MGIPDKFMDQAVWMMIGVGSLLGTVLLSIGSNLLTPYSERVLRALSATRKLRSRRKRLRFRNAVVHLASNRRSRSHSSRLGHHAIQFGTWALAFVIALRLAPVGSESDVRQVISVLSAIAFWLLVPMSMFLLLLGDDLLKRCNRADVLLDEIEDREEDLGRHLEGDERKQFLAECDLKLFSVTPEDIEWQKAHALKAELKK